MKGEKMKKREDKSIKDQIVNKNMKIKNKYLDYMLHWTMVSEFKF